eukprot:2290249-Rhodomonas_salina.1
MPETHAGDAWIHSGDAQSACWDCMLSTLACMLQLPADVDVGRGLVDSGPDLVDFRLILLSAGPDLVDFGSGSAVRAHVPSHRRQTAAERSSGRRGQVHAPWVGPGPLTCQTMCDA